MIIRLVILFAVVLMSSPVSAQEETVLKDQKDKLSYAIGMDIANSFKRQSIDVNPAILSKGMQDVLSGGKTVMTEQEMKETLMAFQKEMMAKQAAMMRELGEKNKKEGEAFLAENKKKEGVVTLPDGLAYKVIKEGVGKKPKATDTVTAHYRGTLVDGSEFDSS